MREGAHAMKDDEMYQDARSDLARLASYLRESENVRTRMNPHLIPVGNWEARVTRAIERYLSGEAKSLDAAFGLTPARGRPRKRDEHEAMSHQVWGMRKAGKSWRDITNEIGRDVRTLQRLVARFLPKLAAKEIGDSLRSLRYPRARRRKKRQ